MVFKIGALYITCLQLPVPCWNSFAGILPRLLVTNTSMSFIRSNRCPVIPFLRQEESVIRKSPVDPCLDCRVDSFSRPTEHFHLSERGELIVSGLYWRHQVSSSVITLERLFMFSLTHFEISVEIGKRFSFYSSLKLLGQNSPLFSSLPNFLRCWCRKKSLTTHFSNELIRLQKWFTFVIFSATHDVDGQPARSSSLPSWTILHHLEALENGNIFLRLVESSRVCLAVFPR